MRKMPFRQHLAPAVWLWLASAGAALAAEEPALHNVWALAVQRWLLHWGVWYTGLHRLDDGAFFGLVCCIILTAFMVSAIGLMLFKTRGLNFTLGWIVGIPVCLATMLFYCKLRPFPNYEDMSWLFVSAGAAQLAVLTLCWVVKQVFASADGTPQKPAPARGGPVLKTATGGNSFLAGVAGLAKSGSAPTPEAMRDRMKLAVRTSGADKPKR